mgnify:CR=1 FL=1
MLHIKNLTYRIAGRTLISNASAHLPKGHRAAIVGRNGVGKTSLFKLIMGQVQCDGGDVTLQKDARLGIVAQEIKDTDLSVIDFVLKSHKERDSLLKEAETVSAPDRIAEIFARLDEINAYEAPSKASKILAGLGFNESAQSRPLSSYSGGWRMRVALAAALFLEPDLLLLDEPTNHLDLEAAAWLENFLKKYPRTLLMISHDRNFLNAVVDRIYHLDQQTLSFYNGNFDFFEKTRRERLAGIEAERKKQEAQAAHMQSFIDRFRAKSSKARQVQSRIKMLERFEPLSTSEEDPLISLHFPDPEHLAPPLITLDNVQAGYGDNVVLKGLNQRLDSEDRIALLGANGNGKSTFAKLLAGMIQPLSGTIHRSNRLRVGYYHQHQLEALIPHETAYEHMATAMKGAIETKVRARLGRFGFTKEKSDVPVEKLSGGEKARLNFALISFEEPQIILLDEPTNHLDLETRESLIFAINAFGGAVVLISHDWHLLEMTADRLWLVEAGTVKRFEGTLDEYRQMVIKGVKIEDLQFKKMKKKLENYSKEEKKKKKSGKKKK